MRRCCDYCYEYLDPNDNGQRCKGICDSLACESCAEYEFEDCKICKETKEEE